MSSVDVVIPCYNYGRYLRQCVQSVLAQDEVEVRVLIIDDYSADNTPEVGRALAAEDSRVEYRRHETNQGHIATYNEGFDWTRGDATLLISADDLLLQGALARALQVINVHPEVGLVWGRQVVIGQHVPEPKVIEHWDFEVVGGADFVSQMCRTGSNPVTTPTAVVRTAILHDVGGYNSELPHTADMEYWLLVAARSSVGIVAADQAYKRMHTQNMQVEFVTLARRDLEQRLAGFDSFFRRDGHRLGNAAQLHESARRALARQAFWAASEAFDRGCGEECKSLLDFSRKLDPSLPQERCWRRLAWKRRLGTRTWRTVRPLVDCIRHHQ